MCIHLLRLLPLVFVLMACQGGPNLDEDFRQRHPPTSQKAGEEVSLNPGDMYRLGSENIHLVLGAFKFQNGCLRGEGQLRLRDRPKPEDSWNLALDVDLPAGSKLRLLAHARGDQSGGLILDLASREVWIEAAGERVDWSALPSMSDLLSRDRLRFSMDIHNDEHHKQFSHLIFFDERGQVLMDSALDTDGVPGKGKGVENHLFLSGGAALCGVNISQPRSGG